MFPYIHALWIINEILQFFFKSKQISKTFSYEKNGKKLF